MVLSFVPSSIRYFSKLLKMFTSVFVLRHRAVTNRLYHCTFHIPIEAECGESYMPVYGTTGYVCDAKTVCGTAITTINL